MSYNVLVSNFDFAASLREIRKQDPDVVAIMEYANQWHTAMDTLGERYPYQIREPRWHGYGIAMFSRLPIVDSSVRQLTADTIDSPVLSMTVEVSGQPLNIVAAHLVSPTRPARLEIRNRQLQGLQEYVASVDGPAMLVGDFNCTPSSQYFAGMMRHAKLRDSRNGFGRLPTWPSWAGWLAIPIDHVLVSEQIHVHQWTLGESHGSDHCPVVVDVSVSSVDAGE